MSTIIGKILDEKYEIVELIGQGGMAYVYKAMDLRLHRYVAVKVLKSEFMDNEQFLKKFLREAQADAKLTHPNIVNVYDVGIEDGYYYIVMEYVDGDTLKSLIKVNQKLTLQLTVEIVLAVAAGLAHAHKNEIIHRDIKPHNILMTSSHVPKVADFGIARAINSSTVTATEEALGSVHYISPEQARGGFLDERSDLYSLGIMMFEMLTGQLPYDADTPVAVALKHVQNNVGSPSDIDKEVPLNISQIVLNLTRRKPEDRYQNADALIADLRKLQADPTAMIEPTYAVAMNPSKKTSQGKTKAPTNVSDKKWKKLFHNKRFMVSMLVGIVCLGIIAVIVFADVLGEKVSVPNVVGMTMEEASLQLSKVGLTYDTDEQFSSDVAKGSVISQTPNADEMVRTSEVIQLVISLGPETSQVPNVVGMSYAEATAAIKSAGFTVGTENYEFNDNYESGYIYDQNPSGGILTTEGTSITIYVSKGKDNVTVPNLIGKSLDDAKSQITSAGLAVGTVSQEVNNSYPAGQVIKQSPTAYSSVAKNTTINLTVSLGSEKTVTQTFDLSKYVSGFSDVEVQVNMMDDSSGTNSVSVYDKTCSPSQKITVTFTGAGVKYYELIIDGESKTTGKINFNN
ncbi:MAG: Stk1 family PASTA domain-containing Ser/Thr kinase [Anaerofustis sp.]